MKQFTVPEVAELLGIHEQTVRTLISEGKVKSYIFGHNNIIEEDDLNEYIEKYRSKLPDIYEIGASLGIERNSAYYTFLMKRHVDPDAVRVNNYCYGEKKIRQVMNEEGWVHPRYKDTGRRVIMTLPTENGWIKITIKGNDAVREVIDEGKANISSFYTKEQMAAALDISPRTIEGWLSSGKIKPSGRFPKGEVVWSHRDAIDVLEEYGAYGLTISEVMLRFNVGYTIANYLISSKFRLNVVGKRNNARVYDKDEVLEVMRVSDIMDKNVRIMRIDGSIRPEHPGWFLVYIDEREKRIKVISEYLVTLERAQKELRLYNSEFGNEIPK